MKIKEMFSKPIDRKIDGVIKADAVAEDNLHNELSEYVLTEEAEKLIGDFLDDYTAPYSNNDNIGVWISGFFGSGKSHLLKMLSLVLENRSIRGQSAIDIFLLKCSENNKIFQSNLKKVASIPSRSLLFNIDQLTTASAKEEDALVSVFLRVFNQMCGYDDKLPFVAQFERDMDNEGHLQTFKEAYQTIAGKPWEKGRTLPWLEKNNIAKAYEKATGESAGTDLMDKYSKSPALSIRDFADILNGWLDKQPSAFRLNFFVDEIGQYIADNTKLMLNLQTISETLYTQCKGRVWLMVTAQADMEAAIGQMNKAQSNDFSKIKDRFKIRMNLTSASVDEVIEKRLLEKTTEAKHLLLDLYAKENGNFRTLFGFGDNSKEYSIYKDEDHFVRAYPFVPYQFALFQDAIQRLSDYNAFQGRHTSVGSRSMLSVFQNVARTISDEEQGGLATFDRMYEGIRPSLKTGVDTIARAEKELDGFAVRVLKALFLVKYVNGFNATPRNITVLLTDGFDVDIPALRQQVEQALATLESRTLVTRDGDNYAYLTDEEMDIEKAIGNIDIEPDAEAVMLKELIFDQIISDSTVSLIPKDTPRPFGRYLDGILHGNIQKAASELAVRIVSPNNIELDTEDKLVLISAEIHGLWVAMPPDDQLIRDIRLYRQTEKYISQNSGKQGTESSKYSILGSKQDQNLNRKTSIRERTAKLLGESVFYIKGHKESQSTGNAKERIKQGLVTLARRLYPNMAMLKDRVFDEAAISDHVQQDPALFDVELDEAQIQIFKFIQQYAKGGGNVTIGSVLEKFQAIPYGWSPNAALCMVASLQSAGKVDITLSGEHYKGSELAKLLCNTRERQLARIEVRPDISQRQMSALRSFGRDFFNKILDEKDAAGLAEKIREQFSILEGELQKRLNSAGEYPFVSALESVRLKVRQCCGYDWKWYYDGEFQKQTDELLDDLQDVIEPIEAFFNKGGQVDIYDEARQFLSKQVANIDKDSGAYQRIAQILDDPECYLGNKLSHVRTDLDALKKDIQTRLDQAKTKARQTLNHYMDKLKADNQFRQIRETDQKWLVGEMNRFADKVAMQEIIDKVVLAEKEVEEELWLQIQYKLQEFVRAQQPGTPVKETVRFRSIVSYGSSALESEQDVEQYLETVRKACLEQIQKNKRILL